MGEAMKKVEEDEISDNAIGDQIDDDETLEQSKEAIGSAFCSAAVTDNLDEEQREILSLITMSLAYADDAKIREDHVFINRLRKILPNDVEIDKLCETYLKRRDDFPMFLDKFSKLLQQSTVLEALHYIRTGESSEEKAVQADKGLDYNSLQKNISSQDIIKDVISLFLRAAYKTQKADASKDQPVTPTDVLQKLIPNVYEEYKAKDLLRNQHVGSWINILDKSKPKIKQLKETIRRKDEGGNIRYIPFTISDNEVLNQIDKHINFTDKVSEDFVYTLLAIMGHTASSDGEIAEPEEAKFIGQLIYRMDLEIDQEEFRDRMTIPFETLLEKVSDASLGKVIYYEMLGIILSNLDVDEEEKKLLAKVTEKFNITSEDLEWLHTRLYLDSALRGVEENLLESSAMFENNDTVFHDFQRLLGDLDNVRPSDLLRRGREVLNEFDPIDIPTIAPKKVKVAIISLVGNALGLDGVLDDDEKQLLAELMAKLEVTGPDLKAYPELMRGASINQLCRALDKWFIAKNMRKYLPAVAFYVLKAIGSDGVIDKKEEVFKNALFKELGLHSSQYARMLLRVYYDHHLLEEE